jgi:hypothetical protein
LIQVLDRFDLTPDRAFSRCPVCNVPLRDIPKQEAWNHVPSYVYATQSVFRLCPECGRFFWRGTHWQDMLDRLQALRTD